MKIFFYFYSVLVFDSKHNPAESGNEAEFQNAA